MEVEIPHRVMCGQKKNTNDIPTHIEMAILTLTSVQNGDQIVIKSVFTDITFIYKNDLIIETQSVRLSCLIRPNKMNISQQSCIIDKDINNERITTHFNEYICQKEHVCKLTDQCQ